MRKQHIVPEEKVLISPSHSAALHAAAAKIVLLHGLDAPSKGISQRPEPASLLEANANSLKPASSSMPDASTLYMVTEAIRAAGGSTQPGSICQAARDFAELLPQLQKLTAEAQPLAYGQLLDSLQPVVAELLAWHEQLRPAMQQQLDRTVSLASSNSVQAQLTAALMIDLLACYVAAYVEMLASCSQLPASERAAVSSAVAPLMSWVQHFFAALTILAAEAVSEVKASLRCECAARQAAEHIIALHLSMDQVHSFLTLRSCFLACSQLM